MRFKKNKIIITIFSVSLFLCVLIVSSNIIISNLNLTNNQSLIVDYINAPDKQSTKESKLHNTSITNNEIKHLDDVNKMFKLKTTILNITIILISTILLIIRKTNKNYKNRTKYLFFYSGLTTFITPFIIIILSIINFTLIFEIFHNILFPQGNYSFPPDSFLISNLPESFFQTIAIEIFILTISIGLIMSLVSYYFIKKVKK